MADVGRDDGVELGEAFARRADRCGAVPQAAPDILGFLLRHAGRPVSKTMILEHVWDYSFDPQTNVVDVVVSRLRAKVDPDHTRIETVRGVGYKLVGGE